MLKNLCFTVLISLLLISCESIKPEATALAPQTIQAPKPVQAKIKEFKYSPKTNENTEINTAETDNSQQATEQATNPSTATTVLLEQTIEPEPEISIALPSFSISEKPATPPKPTLVWERFNQGLAFPPADNKRIQAQKNWYLKHKDYLNRVLLRAKPLLPYILDEIERLNLPTEYALLPIVESAYQTYAYSHGRASGIWQIIPSTGRHLGLKQNWWYDGRRDLYLSSTAALSYLKTLAKQFNGNHVLALASYNAGPGKIRSAVRYNKRKKRPSDYWHLTKIRPETRNYVPKLYALTEILSNPQQYGIDLLAIEDKPGFDRVEITKQIDIATVAQLAEINLETFYKLNPAFNQWATPPQGTYHILLPLGKKKIFEKNLAELPNSRRIKWVRHKIKSGETLSSIAQKYHTQTALLVKVNHIKHHRIRAGKHLMIPTATRSLKLYTNSDAARLARTQNKKRGSTKITHIVKSGESLWTIAKLYGVNHKALAKWNGMAPIDTLSIGSKLVIWDAKPNRTPAFASLANKKQLIRKLKYTVRKGDSIARIADKFNLRVSDIKRWNRIGKYIQPGQKIKLWVDVTTQSS